MTQEMREARLTSITVAAERWVFTQSHPLGGGDFAKEAEARGLALDAETLRVLNRKGVLSPMFAVHEMRVGEPVAVDPSRPGARGTLAAGFLAALTDGRLSDPATTPLPATWRFDSRRLEDPQGWWNGLLYSRWQVVELVGLQSYLRRGYRRGSREKRSLVLPAPDERVTALAHRSRRLTLLLTAIEARYWPQIRPDVLSLVNAEEHEWMAYRDRFDPHAAAGRLGVTAKDVRAEAERLLFTAHNLDPLGSWSHIVMQAPAQYWEILKGPPVWPWTCARPPSSCCCSVKT